METCGQKRFRLGAVKGSGVEDLVFSPKAPYIVDTSAAKYLYRSLFGFRVYGIGS